jgi:simple sugar transport system permease protein
MLARIKEINWRSLIIILLSLLMALFIGAIFMLASGYNPLEVYWMMFQGAFISSYNLMNTLQRATPLIFTSLAVLIAFRTGTFNIGVEGQLFMGAISAAWAGFAFKGLPALVHIPLALGIAMLAGALYALIPAILKFNYGVNEIITTIMLNTVATLFTGYLVNYPLRENAMAAQTPKVLETARLARLVNYSQVNVGIFIAIFCVILFWYIFKKTTFGFRTRMVGEAAPFAEYAGINPIRTAFAGMLISGAVAGLAGGVELLGVHYRFVEQFATGLGFDGILIAWLGKGTPIGAFLAAIFYGGMKTGAMTVDWMTDIPRQLADTILAIVIFFMAAEGLFDWLWILKKKFRSKRKGRDAEVIENA